MSCWRFEEGGEVVRTIIYMRGRVNGSGKRIMVTRQHKDPWEIHTQDSKGKQSAWVPAFLQTHLAAVGQAGLGSVGYD